MALWRARLEGRAGVELVPSVPHDEVPARIARAHVVCQPSLIEPFGQALLEAMACGRSVVATRVGGPPEFVPPEAGVLVDPLGVDAIVDALRVAAALPCPNPAAREAAERPRRQRAGAPGRRGARASRPTRSRKRAKRVVGRQSRHQMSSKIRVLIADDHRLFAEALNAILAAEPGIEVVGRARNGEEAVDQALALKPDVILMDIAMPVVDGVEATKRIRKKQRGARVLMLTGSNSRTDVARARDAGAAAYVTKDRIAAQLIEAIRELAAN